MNFIFRNKIFLLSLAVVFFALTYFIHKPAEHDAHSVVKDFEYVLHQKEQRLNAEMLSLAKRTQTHSYNQLFAEFTEYYSDLLNDGLALLIYENDTLKFWSDNSIAVENWVKEVCLDTRLVKLHNGWFEVMHPHTNANTTKNIVGLILIKNEFPYQNKYLVNNFQKDFNVPSGTRLIPENIAGSQIKNINEDILFSLDLSSTEAPANWLSYLSFIFALLAFVFFVKFLETSSTDLSSRIGKNFSIFLFILTVGVLRYLTIKLSFPSAFYTLDLFNPKIYADAGSIWLTSLGDLLINVILLLYITYFAIQQFTFDNLYTRLKRNNKIFLAFILFLAFFWFSWTISDLLIGLIKNSNISFSLNNFFSLNKYTFIALLITGLLLFVFFLLSDKLLILLKSFQLDIKQYIFTFLISALIHTIILHFLGILDLVIILWPFIIIIAIAFIRQKNNSYSFFGILLLISIFSTYAAHIFSRHTQLKEGDIRKVYAEKLAAEKDPLAELLFREIESRITNDSILVSYVNSFEKKPSEFEKRLRQEYFSGFWERYDLRLALFDSMCVPVVISQNTLFDNNLYFDELIEKKGEPSSCENFSFINNSSGKISYIAKLPIFKSIQTKSKFGTLYIELDARFVSDEIGFPELLLDKNVGLAQELSNYSYAKYKNNQLINQYGKFSYPFSSEAFNSFNSLSFADRDSFNHLIYRPDEKTLIIISMPSESTIEKITGFSYLFTFFSLLLLIIIFTHQLLKGSLRENFNFKYRIQVLFVLIVLLSLGLFGGGTVYYIKNQIENKNKEIITEKIHSVLIDLGNKLASENNLNTTLTNYSSFILKKLSGIFFTDINIYDTQGNLYASSRPKIFDEGLTSKKMNPKAFKEIAVLGKTEFIHNENIGQLKYLSVYIPFKNNEGKLLGYLNLPYFAKQNELEKEISDFLIALINIYVLLFALSIVAAIFISGYVTKPLKLIQDKLGKIKLGKTNELIEWKEKDEIGNLVNEYNRMIGELAKSAELLAKSERESAWREMAKQVAHEIKNPLTPMKLSLQHLQQTWKDNAPDKEQKFNRLTQNIIEQIDTLSLIATEFSNFAQMPKAVIDNVNVSVILKSSIGLFIENENIEITLEDKSNIPVIVSADKDQLLRVFNNLIKNAIQSIPENITGKINVVILSEKDQFVISINDNGCGIDVDIINKIFTPNFTTKTAGMGLGLAMVKSIVESYGGKVWFETKFQEGSTFYVALPSAKKP